MLKITLDLNQYTEIEALNFWIAENSYILEKYGNSDTELPKIRKTIEFIFEQLDGLKVPFWVQNTVIAHAENWRTAHGTYLKTFLESKNIFIGA